jgi:hypothetical protein
MNKEQIRNLVRQSLLATKDLEKAISQGDKELVQKAIEKGALPDLVQYPNTKGTPMGSAISRGLRHKDLELLEYLLKEGAPLVGENGKSLGHILIETSFLEAFPLLAKFGYTPENNDYIIALEKDNLSALQALDKISFFPRDQALCKDFSAKASSYLPIFLAQSKDMVDYLMQTGATLNQYSLGQFPWFPLDWLIARAVSFKSNQSHSILNSTLGAGVAAQFIEMGNKDPTDAGLAMIEWGHPVSEKSLLIACRQGYPLLVRKISSLLPNIYWEEKHDPVNQSVLSGVSHYRQELKKSNEGLLQELIAEELTLKDRQEIEKNTPTATRSKHSPRI